MDDQDHPEGQVCPTCNGDGMCLGMYGLVLGDCDDCNGIGVVADHPEPPVSARDVLNDYKRDTLKIMSGRTPGAHAAARTMIGRRVRWDDNEHGGTIIGTGSTGNGYARFVVEWDQGAPDWWSTEVAPSARGLVVQ